MAYKAADAVYLPRPHEVTTTLATTMINPVGTLTAQAQWADKLTDHHAGAIVRFRNDEVAQVVEYLSGH